MDFSSRILVSESLSPPAQKEMDRRFCCAKSMVKRIGGASVVGSGRAVGKQFLWVAAENPGTGFNWCSEKIHWSQSDQQWRHSNPFQDFVRLTSGHQFTLFSLDV